MTVRRMAPFDFVVSDMDGTLLASTHRLSDVTRRTLLTLMQRHHIPVILATGRNYADVRVVNDNLQRYFAECHMSPQNLAPTYLITSNGAVVHDAATRQVVSTRCLPVELVRTLYSFVPASETRINTNIYQHDRWFARYDWPSMLQYHAESGLHYEVLPCLPEAKTEVTDDNKSEGQGASVAEGDLTGVSMFFFCAEDAQLLEQLERQLLERFGSVASIGFSAIYCLNVTAKEVNKADGLRAVFAALPRQHNEQDSAHAPEGQVPSLVEDRMRRTVAFGDQVNDYELLTQVGKGCIVANCSPRLREMCPQLEMIAGNDQDGVAHKLCELFDLPPPS